MDFAKKSGADREVVASLPPDHGKSVSSASAELPSGNPAVAPAVEERPLPRWLRRVSAIIFIALMIEAGLILIVLPWKLPDIWLNSAFVATRPALRAFLAAYFVRGIVSGLGLIDVWIGLWEAVHFRDSK